jgi:hypothetical protein
VNTPTSIQRSQELRRRAKETDALPHSAERMARKITEHRELLELSLSLSMELETALHELGMVMSMLHEAVETFTKDTTGFDWKIAFKDKKNALKHFQAMHGIARYFRLRTQE